MDYECTIIVGDSDYAALSKKDQKGFELVGLYDQEYIQKVLKDNKLATPYEERSKWTDDPKENHDFLFNELTNGFVDLLKLSGVEKLEGVETNIYVKTLPKYMGQYKDGDLSEYEFLLEEKKAKKKGLLFIPKVYKKYVHLLGAEDWQEECIDEQWKMQDFCWMGSIDYVDICKQVDDVNLWVHEEMPLNLAQLEKIYGNGKYPFDGNYHSSTPLYEAHKSTQSFAEIFEYQKIDSLIVCKTDTVILTS